MNEQWKPVAGYEGFYEVSDLGHVRSVDRQVQSYGGRVYLRRGRPLAQNPDKDGYLKVHLSKNGVKRHHSVHTLVLTAFVGPRPDGQEVRHLDGCPQNNALVNLAWGTMSENRHDCYAYGGRSGRGKLYRQDVLEIRARLKNGERKTDLAREYGVHFMNIHAIENGTHFSYLNDNPTSET